MHRRAKRFAPGQDSEVLDCNGVTFDKRALTVRVDGEVIDLSGKERDILMLLMSGQGRVFARERILNAVWGVNADPLTNVVDVYIGRLRRKLRRHGQRIVTLRNIGYRFD
jgi:DNA-binding response OmpR family regulator